MPPKSGYSRTRNVDYDDDDTYDDDDYYEEEEANGGMTDDDKEQMRIGTIRVREALGEFEAGVSDAQIQEALWHYYYDVAKSVSYLKNKLGGVQTPKAAPKKEKTVSKFDQVANAAAQKAPTTPGKFTYTQMRVVEEPADPKALSLPPTTMPQLAVDDDFFWDIPWGNVPADRVGVITVDKPCCRLGLLGGSSKLAALAAKRRKEREDAEAASAAKVNGDADAAVAMLDKLTVKGKDAGPTSSFNSERPARKYPARKRSPSPQPELRKEETMSEPIAPQPAVVVESPAQRATASMFASTLCGSSPPVQPKLESFVPFAKSKNFESLKAFDSPSPDDIVRAAQAKGAGGGRR